MVNFSYPGQPQQQGSSQQQSQGYPMGLPQMGPLTYDDLEKEDLIRYQLDLSKTKSDIAHWLNGDFPIEEKGKIVWQKNNKDKYKVLNDFGIREVLRIINMYLTKDVIMSNLPEEKINDICKTISLEINDLFFTKYDEIGMDTSSRQKNYSTIIITLSHIIYITLMRAKDGKERQGVSENKVVSQAEINYPNLQKTGFFSRRFGRK